MNNHDISALFVARKVASAANGRNNLRFKDGILWSYDNVVAMWDADTLYVSADTFTATSSRHQSAVKRVADNYVLVPGLTDLVGIKNLKDMEAYSLQRRLAISEYERRKETSKSPKMIEYLDDRIDIERNAIKLALKRLPFHDAMVVFSDQGFFRVFSGRK
jgi:hypothetical protein